MRSSLCAAALVAAAMLVVVACAPQTHVEGQRIRATAETVVERVDVTGGLHNGRFETGAAGVDRLIGNFHGPRHEEAYGAFDTGAYVGAFGALRE